MKKVAWKRRRFVENGEFLPGDVVDCQKMKKVAQRRLRLTENEESRSATPSIVEKWKKPVRYAVAGHIKKIAS